MHGANRIDKNRVVSEWTPPTPKPLQWWWEDAAHRVIDGVASRLSGPQAFRLGELLGELAWHILPKRRHIVLRNLRIATGGTKSREEIQRCARQCFRRTGANLISVARTAHVTPDQLGTVLKVKNDHLLVEALGEGKGLVLLLTHMGNWELLSRLCHFFPPGTPSGAFYRPLNNPRLDERVRQRREADGVRMFSKRDNPLKVAGFLREGAVIGILADQRVGPKGEATRFFGRYTRSSPLPTLLARRAKCPVLALSLVCAKPGVWEAEFKEVGDPPHTAHAMQALESAMAASLVDVFWFQERWKTYLAEAMPPAAWIADGSSRDGMRHRAVRWLPKGDEDWQLPDGWDHPDIHYETITGDLPSIGAWRARLRELEWSAPLPIDFLLTRHAPAILRRACKAEAIPLVSLS